MLEGEEEGGSSSSEAESESVSEQPPMRSVGVHPTSHPSQGSHQTQQSKRRRKPSAKSVAPEVLRAAPPLLLLKLHCFLSFFLCGLLLQTTEVPERRRSRRRRKFGFCAAHFFSRRFGNALFMAAPKRPSSLVPSAVKRKRIKSLAFQLLRISKAKRRALYRQRTPQHLVVFARPNSAF